MKKNLFIISICFIVIYYLFKYSDIISISIINTSYLFLSKIVPSILPIFIISKILINYNLPYYLSKIFHNNIYIYILIISLLSGSPNNVVLLNDLLHKKIISTKEANTYIKCSFFQNPLFIYIMIKNIFNTKIAIIVILIQIFSNIIIYLTNPIKNNNIIKIKQDKLINTLINSIKDSINILETIYITIVIFNIIIIILPSSLSPLIGLLEVTQGLNYLSNININYIYKIILTTIYISFGGLSIHIQIKSIIDEDINYNNFLIGRIYQIIISLICITIFLIKS